MSSTPKKQKQSSQKTQQSLLSFFKSPSKTSIVSSQPFDGSAAETTNLLLTPTSKPSSQDACTPNPQTLNTLPMSKTFSGSINSQSSAIEELNSTKNLPAHPSSYFSFQNSALETNNASILNKISTSKSISKKRSNSSLFDDSDNFDFSVNEELLQKLELNSPKPKSSKDVGNSSRPERLCKKTSIVTQDFMDVEENFSEIDLVEEDTELDINYSDLSLDDLSDSEDEALSVKFNLKLKNNSSNHFKKKNTIESDDEISIDLDLASCKSTDIDNTAQNSSINDQNVSFSSNSNSQTLDSKAISVNFSDHIQRFTHKKNSPVSTKQYSQPEKKAITSSLSQFKFSENSDQPIFNIKSSKLQIKNEINTNSTSQGSAKNVYFLSSKQERAKDFQLRNRDRYSWLEDIKDENGLKPGDSGYDKRTLYIPKSAWEKFTPFELQYWKIKTKHWDTVVFFKKGKFYELFEKDADIGHQFFDLKLTDRVNMRMVGVPESSFEHWASQFVAKGYKVAKVEQMESSLAKTMRERDGTDLSVGSNRNAASKNSTKESEKTDKVVRRELTCVLTAGTLVDSKMISGDLAIYCLAIVETNNLFDDTNNTANYSNSDSFDGNSGSSYGIAFCDTATAKFYFAGILNDDINKTQLTTLLVQINPREVIFVSGGAGPSLIEDFPIGSINKNKNEASESFSSVMDMGDGMNGLSPSTWKVIKGACSVGTIWNKLPANSSFWDYNKSKQELKTGKYFKNSESFDIDNKIMRNYPDILASLESSGLGKLVYTAFGGLVSYLRSLKLDYNLLTIGNFESYQPLRNNLNLVVDGATLSNLDIFTVDGDNSKSALAKQQEGSIFSLVNNTITPFGTRLMYQWVCHPLCNPAAINNRLDVVEFILSNKFPELVTKIKTALTGLPDFERLLSRVHSGSCRVAEFIKMLDSFENLTNNFNELIQLIQPNPFSNEESLPKKLREMILSYPVTTVNNILVEFKESFIREKAEKENSLVPYPNKYKNIDNLAQKLKKIDVWLEEHLDYHRKLYKCKTICYKSIGKETNQLEIPLRIRVANNYMRKSASKDFHRYYSPELVVKLREQSELLEHMNAVLRDYRLVIYQKWAGHYRQWMEVVSLIAEFDCLISLAVASEQMGAERARPEFISDGERNNKGGYIEFKSLKHPCLVKSMTSSITEMSSGFVPNDIVLGTFTENISNFEIKKESDDASVILLTGPNMGGKSTLIRQICVSIILAQIGCYLPAKSAKLTIFNRIFTRLGARDNLLMGQSTFMVEMTETASFLQLATKSSFVAVDELGRGTSTHDGESIAYSVLHSLASRIGCLSIFSTHYGLLASDLCGRSDYNNISIEQDSENCDKNKADGESQLVDVVDKKYNKMIYAPHIRPMHMACLVDQKAHRVTFLYKLKKGIAEHSHGMNVAHMAGVPLDIVKQAEIIAQRFEHSNIKSTKPAKFEQNGNVISSSVIDNDGEANRLLPQSLLSDFANLLRVSKLKMESTSYQQKKAINVASSRDIAENYVSCVEDDHIISGNQLNIGQNKKKIDHYSLGLSLL
ncbi:hypothetical protein BB561_006417 [Smittium simulii]|uniref:DNA mismatch repair protein n=1 Tax=Smittium simulii TaxID=133385 RepID=A0A2T9Y4H1_9FUNG|nr:hypothetical protein BB561_006417 [Smittium simulii]